MCARIADNLSDFPRHDPNQELMAQGVANVITPLFGGAGTRAVVLEMHRLISIDASGLEALQQLHRMLKRRDIGLVLANVNEQPLSLIRRSGFEAIVGADAIVPNFEQAMDKVG